MVKFQPFTEDDLLAEADRLEHMLDIALREVVGNFTSGMIAASYVNFSLDDLQKLATDWAKKVLAILWPEIVQVFTHGSQLVNDALGVERPVDSPNPIFRNETAEEFLSQSRNRLSSVGDDLWEHARSEILTGFQLGESIEELAARIRTAADLSEPRAHTVARTEAIAAANAGAFLELRSYGLDATKEWLATNDSHTRPTHAEAEGQIVPLGGKLRVGDALLDFPGDPSGPPGEVINCRCTLLYEIADEDVDALVAAVEGKKGASHDGAMIALLPSEEWAGRVYVDGGEAPKELHATLAYLGDAVNIPDEVRDSIIAALEAYTVSRPSPHDVEAFAASIFNHGDDDACIVLGLGGSELDSLHDEVLDRLTAGAAGWNVPEQRTPWIPHVTLLYTNDLSKIADAVERTGPVQFTHIRAAFGGVNYDIPFADTALAAAGNFVEAEHPRGKGGKFAKKAGGGGKSFAPTKAIYGKPNHGDVVAVHEGGNALEWDGDKKKFVDDFGTEYNKTEAYKLVKESGWGAPAERKAAPKVEPSKPADSPPSATPGKQSSGTTGKVKKFAPTGIAYGKHENGAVVAELAAEGANGRMVWNAVHKKFVVQGKAPGTDNWFNVAFLGKGEAYEKLKVPGIWKNPEGGSAAGPNVVAPPAPKVIKPKNVEMTPTQMGLLNGAIFNPSGGMTPEESLFDIAFIVAQKHNASIADVLNSFDVKKGVKVESGQLSPTSNTMSNWLQTAQGKAVSSSYLKDFDLSNDILGYTGSKPKPAYSAPKTWNTPPSANPVKPSDVEKGVRVAKTRTPQEMKAIQKRTPPPWTATQQAALRAYSGAAYSQMNGCLRGKFPCDPDSHVAHQIEEAKKAMRPLGVEVTVFRGVGFEMFKLPHNDIESLLKMQGDVVRDKGFVSTSVDVTRKFPKPITMTVHVPEGAPAAYIEGVSSHANERELLLQAGTKFKILKVNPPSPPKYVNTHVELEVVL